MPRLPLLIKATLIGAPSIAQVASSWLVIWKHPSPSIAQTSASGRAILAPMAAAGDVHRVRAGDLAQLLDHILRAQAAVALRSVAQRVGVAHAVEVFPPG